MIETLFTFFALGTFGFWLLMTIASVIFIASIENEHYKFPTIVLVLLGIAYWKPIINGALDWRGILAVIAGYIVIGMAWSVYRWFRYVKSRVEYYKKLNGDELTESNHSSLKEDVDVSNNKSRITAWIAYWPWSLIWNITGDFFTMAYESMISIYKRIADSALSSIKVKEPLSNKELITDADRNIL